MEYYMAKETNYGFQEGIDRAIAELKEEGFGVLTEIDVKQTLKNKIGVDFPNYKILGACNPTLAHRALSVEVHVGAMLPCNVVVRETKSGKVEIFAVDPLASMSAIGNEELKAIASEVKTKLEKVIQKI